MTDTQTDVPAKGRDEPWWANVKELEGWIILPVAAEEMGLSRQWFYDKVARGDLQQVRRLRGTGERPAAILLRRAEVEKLIVSRAEADTCEQCRALREQGQPAEICAHGAVVVPDDPELDAALDEAFGT